MTLPETFQKLVAVRHSKSFRDAVEIQTVSLDPPKPDEIVVKNLYAGVNAADLMMAAGQYLLPTPVPCGMGAEAVGEVVAVGQDVTAYEPGNYVLMNAIGCGYTEYYTIKATHAVPIPQASAEIMSLSIGGLTASIGLNITGEMQQGGEVVLVTAAAGGTGQFAVQLAKLAGNHVIGTCGSDEKAEMLKSLGCDRVVNYKKENLRDVLKAEYPKGVNLVFEGVGREMFDTALDHLARYGRLVTIGFISEYKDKPDIVQDVRVYYKVLGKMASIRGFNLNLFFGKPILAEHMMHLIGLLNEGKLQPQIDPQAFYGVSGAIDAVEYLQAGKNTGKVVVRF
ncbi:MAG: alcohol dehydrogenase [Phototrophicales bacterium]|nr:MAG: alcohol dehydrogenase [Phototrophicales bacterium]RMG72399.1 MAG: alcohol dehydrogenase [Chloroflexota bacterium]